MTGWAWEAGPVLNSGPLRCSRLEPVDTPPDLAGVQFGSQSRMHPSCLNVDLRELTDGESVTEMGELVMADGAYFMRWDVRRPLPFADGCFEWAYSEHLIEHIPLPDAVTWLTEVKRILKPGGLLRLTTPDLRRYVESYLAADGGFFAGYRERLTARGAPPMPDRRAFMVNHIFYFWDHRWIYDADELRYVLQRAGFPDMRVRSFRRGRLPDVAALDDRARDDETIYVEVTA
nr:methyltransferase domain-containing protein [Kibdelosporangium sp. MJ126-NF4]CEL20953.1 Conserved domain protein [Kibdelosporangium sp. MJ126-NF4]CTQ95533.1 Conserved domain protein [Kibdelosporangium sp. MJ126-NF4]